MRRAVRAVMLDVTQRVRQAEPMRSVAEQLALLGPLPHVDLLARRREA